MNRILRPHLISERMSVVNGHLQQCNISRVRGYLCASMRERERERERECECVCVWVCVWVRVCASVHVWLGVFLCVCVCVGGVCVCLSGATTDQGTHLQKRWHGQR